VWSRFADRESHRAKGADGRGPHDNGDYAEHPAPDQIDDAKKRLRGLAEKR
jgi:hypothetical protein